MMPTKKMLTVMRGALWIRMNNLPHAKASEEVRADITEALAWVDAQLGVDSEKE